MVACRRCCNASTISAAAKGCCAASSTWLTGGSWSPCASRRCACRQGPQAAPHPAKLNQARPRAPGLALRSGQSPGSGQNPRSGQIPWSWSGARIDPSNARGQSSGAGGPVGRCHPNSKLAVGLRRGRKQRTRTVQNADQDQVEHADQDGQTSRYQGHPRGTAARAQGWRRGTWAGRSGHRSGAAAARDGGCSPC
jgi:hypothetical protein